MARILIACEYSGRTREAFRKRGHDAWSVDILPAEDNSPWHIIADVFDMIANTEPWDLMIAHPPCTYLANSGARWLYRDVPCYASHESTHHDDVRSEPDPDRFRKMEAGAKFFADLLLAPIPKIAIENPVMHGTGKRAIERYLVNAGRVGMPKTRFVQPWWFGDEAFKATGFTLKNLPPLVKPKTALIPPKPGTPEHKAWSVIHNASPGPDRWKDRSRTFPGIAAAMVETWG